MNLKESSPLIHELVIDNFAGWGGVSQGLEEAMGRSVDIAINHNPCAIAMHRANHPHTLHYCEDVWQIVPLEATGGHPVALCWLSPDCTHYSKARGGRPRQKNIRGLAWVAVRWAATARPRVIMLENVEEIQDWGPLMPDGRPDPAQKGRTFKTFVNALRRQGYRVEWRELRACDFGAPTIRKRLFLIARCDGRPIVWPEPTHGDPTSAAVKSGRLKPWRTAAEIIDWSRPCPSIFSSSEAIQVIYGIKTIRPLADKTLRRIARGTDKFVLNNPAPFIMQGETELTEPLHTVTTKDRNALIETHLCVLRNNQDCKDLRESMPTIMTSPGHFAEVRTVLTKAQDDQDLGHWPEIRELLNKYCGYTLADDEIMLLKINGALYFISDIGLRMLEPRELFNAQSFPASYIIDKDDTGKIYSKAAQIAGCGNSVPPALPKALMIANLPELCTSILSAPEVKTV